MPTTIIDAATVAAAGGTASGTHPIANADRGDEWTYFVRADANGGDLTVTFESALAEGGPYHALAGTEEANISAVDGVAYIRDIGAGEEVQVTVTNNGASDSVVTVEAERTRR